MLRCLWILGVQTQTHHSTPHAVGLSAGSPGLPLSGKGTDIPEGQSVLLDHGADPTDQVKLKNGTGLIVDLRSLTEAFLLHWGIRFSFDKTLSAGLGRLNHSDVGANIGFYTLHWHRTSTN